MSFMRKAAGAIAAPIVTLILTQVLALAVAPPAQAHIDMLFEKYHSMYEEQRGPVIYRGRIIGDWPEQPENLFYQNWPARSSTYEILSAESGDIAGLIYGLALFVKDLDPSVDLERFKRGAQGFHYSAQQLADWGNAVLSGQFQFKSDREVVFISWLLQDGVLTMKDGMFAPSGKVDHVLGAAPGKKRSITLNLDHERLHVMWDEDQAFQKERMDLWNGMSPEEQEEVLATYEKKGYDRSNVENIIEEWSVRANEATPVWKQ